MDHKKAIELLRLLDEMAGKDHLIVIHTESKQHNGQGIGIKHYISLADTLHDAAITHMHSDLYGAVLEAAKIIIGKKS